MLNGTVSRVLPGLLPFPTGRRSSWLPVRCCSQVLTVFLEPFPLKAIWCQWVGLQRIRMFLAQPLMSLALEGPQVKMSFKIPILNRYVQIHHRFEHVQHYINISPKMSNGERRGEIFCSTLPLIFFLVTEVNYIRLYFLGL